MEEESIDFFYTEDRFIVDDLLVFDNDDDDENDVIADSEGSNTATAITDSSSSSIKDLPSFLSDVQDSFSGDLCVPNDELAELEWLSNIVEDSFTTEDLQKLQLISGFNNRSDPKPKSGSENPNNTSPIFTTDVSVPAKARSKRSRAAACNWASRGLLMEAVYDNPYTGATILASHRLPTMNELTKKKAIERLQKKKEALLDSSSVEERRCLHCATDKTPQWRTGPMGPKTLCNACGVRYKSGRLVPEYRPAASPTFVLSKHSNSHRKVMELRRQRELMKEHHEFIHRSNLPDRAMVFTPDGGNYLLRSDVGPDIRKFM